MSDNITLPREVVKLALEAFEAVMPFSTTQRELKIRAVEALRTHLAAPKQEHPGYVIGSHWLETAYSRICAGEAEADVLRDIGLVREEAFLTGVAHLKAENEALRRDAERYRWLREWMVRHSILCIEYGGVWALRKPHVISSSVGRGKTVDAAIDAAMKEGKR